MFQRIALPAPELTVTPTPCEISDSTCDVRSMNSCTSVDALQVALDQALVGRRQPRLARQLVRVIAISLRRRHPSGRGMRLLQETSVRQVRHDVTNRRRAQALAIRARQRARSDWLARRDVGLDDGGQNFAFAFSDTRSSDPLISRCANPLFYNYLECFSGYTTAI